MIGTGIVRYFELIHKFNQPVISSQSGFESDSEILSRSQQSTLNIFGFMCHLGRVI